MSPSLRCFTDRVDRKASEIVNRRLGPDPEEGNDMVQAHIRSGLTNKRELLAEVIVEM